MLIVEATEQIQSRTFKSLRWTQATDVSKSKQVCSVAVPDEFQAAVVSTWPIKVCVFPTTTTAKGVREAEVREAEGSSLAGLFQKEIKLLCRIFSLSMLHLRLKE